jgi:hypothetical protein
MQGKVRHLVGERQLQRTLCGKVAAAQNRRVCARNAHPVEAAFPTKVFVAAASTKASLALGTLARSAPPAAAYAGVRPAHQALGLEDQARFAAL